MENKPIDVARVNATIEAFGSDPTPHQAHLEGVECPLCAAVYTLRKTQLRRIAENIATEEALPKSDEALEAFNLCVILGFILGMTYQKNVDLEERVPFSPERYV